MTHFLVLALLQPFHFDAFCLGLAMALFSQADRLLRNGLTLAHLLLQGFNTCNEIAIHRVVAHGVGFRLRFLQPITVFVAHLLQPFTIGAKLR